MALRINTAAVAVPTHKHPAAVAYQKQQGTTVKNTGVNNQVQQAALQPTGTANLRQVLSSGELKVFAEVFGFNPAATSLSSKFTNNSLTGMQTGGKLNVVV